MTASNAPVTGILFLLFTYIHIHELFVKKSDLRDFDGFTNSEPP
jgi:hypothetical protein